MRSLENTPPEYPSRLRGQLQGRSSPNSTAYRHESSVKSLERGWEHHFPFAVRAANARAACHREGIYHRDIKPANLLLSKAGDCYLMDFGLAWLERGPSDHQLKTRVGTSRYLPPEVFRGERDQRSDVYSLGLTLHELATGRKVWGEIPHQEILERRLELRVPPVLSIRNDIPLHYAAVIDRACHDSIDLRYQSADELRTALRKLSPVKAIPNEVGGLSEFVLKETPADFSELVDVWLE